MYSGNAGQQSSLIDAVIKSRYKLLRKIGQGAFGEICVGLDLKTNENVAVKLEKSDSKRNVLRAEVNILRKLQGCGFFCRYYQCGTERIQDTEYNFLVMELLGENLSEIRKRQTDNKFSLHTTARLGAQMLHCIEEIHETGYLHRDIKPSNFAMGLGPERQLRCYMIDFGLARRFLMPSGEIRPPRDNAGFRGTARYASVFSHQSKELGRRDDLWSLFYVLVEFIVGYLPWRKLKDKDQIGRMKQEHLETKEMLAEMPPELWDFHDHIAGLTFQDSPDYQHLHALLHRLFMRGGPPPLCPYDWFENTMVSVQPPPHSTALSPRDAGKRPLRNRSDGSHGSRSRPVLMDGVAEAELAAMASENAEGRTMTLDADEALVYQQQLQYSGAATPHHSGHGHHRNLSYGQPVSGTTSRADPATSYDPALAVEDGGAMPDAAPGSSSSDLFAPVSLCRGSPPPFPAHYVLRTPFSSSGPDASGAATTASAGSQHHYGQGGPHVRPGGGAPSPGASANASPNNSLRAGAPARRTSGAPGPLYMPEPPLPPQQLDPYAPRGSPGDSRTPRAAPGTQAYPAMVPRPPSGSDVRHEVARPQRDGIGPPDVAVELPGLYSPDDHFFQQPLDGGPAMPMRERGRKGGKKKKGSHAAAQGGARRKSKRCVIS
eukprot:tig00021234_g19387.t1